VREGSRRGDWQVAAFAASVLCVRRRPALAARWTIAIKVRLRDAIPCFHPVRQNAEKLVWGCLFFFRHGLDEKKPSVCRQPNSSLFCRTGWKHGMVPVTQLYYVSCTSMARYKRARRVRVTCTCGWSATVHRSDSWGAGRKGARRACALGKQVVQLKLSLSPRFPHIHRGTGSGERLATLAAFGEWRSSLECAAWRDTVGGARPWPQRATTAVAALCCAQCRTDTPAQSWHRACVPHQGRFCGSGEGAVAGLAEQVVRSCVQWRRMLSRTSAL